MGMIVKRLLTFDHKLECFIKHESLSLFFFFNCKHLTASALLDLPFAKCPQQV